MTPDRPTLTVFVPHYNRTGTLDRMFASLAAQTLPASEILFVDDGSDEDVRPHLAPWMDRLPIRLIRFDSNRGLRAVKHRAVSEAAGDFVAQLDADDTYADTFLEVMSDAMRRTDADVAACLFERRAADGTPREARPAPGREVLVTGDDLLRSVGTECPAVRLWPVNAAGAKMFRTEAARRALPHFDPEVHQVFAEDSVFNMLVLSEARRMICIPARLYDYYEHPNSTRTEMSTVQRDKAVLDGLHYDRAVQALADRLIEARPDLAAVLDRQLFRAHIKRFRNVFPDRKPFAEDFAACLADLPAEVRPLFRTCHVVVRLRHETAKKARPKKA